MERIYKGRLGWGVTITLALPLIFLATLSFSRLAPLLAASGAPIPMALPQVQAGADGSVQAGIPLTLPAATGHAPQLSLSFRGGEGGLLGNWALNGLPVISRNQSRGVHYGSADGYMSSLGGELVQVSDGSFRTKIDNNVIYTKIDDCAAGACSWTARLPDGTLLEFGNTTDSHINGAGSQAHSWALSRSTDLNNNYWTVSYHQNAGAYRPNEIIYTKNDSLGLTERRVQFNYITLNSQKVRYFAGIRRDSNQFLSNIKAYYNDEEIYEHRFSYEQEADSGRYRLSAYQEFIEGVQERTALSFTYTEPDYSFQELNTGTLATGNGTPDYPTCKLGADACLLAQFGGVLDPATLGTAQGVCLLYNINNAARCSIGNTHNTADLNGDGVSDFIASNISAAVPASIADAQIGWILNPANPASPTAFSADNQPFLEAGSQFYADMNGDGKADYIRLRKNSGLPTTYAYTVSMNNGSGFNAPVDFSPPAGMGMGYDPDEFLRELLVMLAGQKIESLQKKRTQPWKKVSIRHRTIYDPLKGKLNFNRAGSMLLQAGGSRDGFGQLADMNGDGLSDYVRIMAPGLISTAFSNGSGFTSERQSNVDTGLGMGEGLRSLGDFDGDGTPDFIVLVNEGGFKLKVYRGNSDGSFSHLHTSSALDGGHKDFRMMLDVNGDGYVDFVRMGAANDRMLITFSNGRSFSHSTTALLDVGNAFGRTFGDLNGDGALDLIRFVAEGGFWVPKARLFSGDNFHGREQLISGFTAATEDELKNKFISFADANGDGRTDMIIPGATGLTYRRSTPSQAGNLNTIRNGAGHELKIDYTEALNSGAIDAAQNSRKSGYSILANRSPRMLMTSLTLSHKGTLKSKNTYNYEDDRIKVGPTPGESRSLGFRRVTEKSFVYKNGVEQEGPAYTVSDFHQEHPTLGFDGAGLPASITVYRKNGGMLSQELPEYSRPPAYPHAGLIKYVETARTKIDASSSVTVRTRSTVLEMDALGNPIRTQNYGDLDSPDDDRITEVSMEYPAEIPAGRPTVIRNRTAAGTSISFQRFSYDSRSNVTRKESGLDAAHLMEARMTYDAAGNILTSTQLGLTTTMEYDTELVAVPVKTTGPNGRSAHATYNLKRGLALSKTDSYGKTIHNIYDNAGRLLRSELDAGGILSSNLILSSNTYEYDANGVLTQTQDVLGPLGKNVSTANITDQWGRKLQSRSSQEAGTVQSNMTYDEFDRPVSATLPHFTTDAAPGQSLSVYDDLGRVIRTESPGPNGILVQTYTPETVETVSFTSQAGPSLKGYAVEAKRRNGQRIYDFKTADGKMLQREYETAYADSSAPGIASAGWVRVRYHYDELGRPVFITRGAGSSRASILENPDQTTRIQYDAYGRKSLVFDPDKGLSSFTYTAEHRPLCSTSPDMATLCKTYDNLGRPIELRQDSPTGKVLVEYRYDENQSAYGQGRLTSLKDDTGERRMHYDLITGKVARLERTYRARGAVKNFDIIQTYDPTGALLKRSFSNTGLSLFYDYHTGGALSRILLEDKDQRILKTGNTMQVLEIQAPDARDNSPRITYGNGVSQDTAHDAASGVMKEVNVYSSYHNDTVAHYGYKWNNENMLTEKSDLLKADALDRSESFIYDQAHRLTEAQGPYGTRSNPARTLNYSYGADGQPLLLAGTVAGYDGNAEHRLKNAGDVSYQYDNESGPGRGNVVTRSTSRSSTSFTYTWQNRVNTISSVTQNGSYSANYIYDHRGNQFAKEAEFGGETSTYHKLDQDYRIFTDGTNEIHRLEIRNRGSLVAQFNFNAFHHLASAGASGNLYQDRLASDMGRLSGFEGGISNSPFLMMSVLTNAWHVVDAVENKGLYLYWTLIFGLLSLALLALVRVWRREPRVKSSGLLPVSLMRMAALSMVLVLYTTSACAPQAGSAQDIFPVINSGFHVVAEGNGSGAAGNGADKLIGTYFFTGTHNGSTDIVTNAQGKVVARFAYDPFGVMNKDLSDLDPDKNGVNYSGRFSFTGQEYEVETGLYNYKARIYDQHTGRFLQPDPVHSDNAGYDNFDRYQYVNNNPVNFVDPDGKRRNAHVHSFNQTTRGFAGGFTRAAKGIKGTIDRIAKGKKYNDSSNSFDKFGRKVGEAGTFARRFFTDIKFTGGVLEGVIDLVASYIFNAFTGRPAPYLTYHHGGFMVHNSFLAGNKIWFLGSQGAYVGGGIGHVSHEDSKAVIIHEAGHMRQFSENSGLENWGGIGDGIKFQEYEADFIQGILNYGASPYLYYQLWGEAGLRTALGISAIYEAGSQRGLFYSIYLSDSYDLSNFDLSKNQLEFLRAIVIDARN